jgi:hypothetical protein
VIEADFSSLLQGEVLIMKHSADVGITSDTKYSIAEVAATP